MAAETQKEIGLEIAHVLFIDIVGYSKLLIDDRGLESDQPAARAEQEQVVRKQKDYGPPVCVLGLIDAALGNKQAALDEGHRAMELLSVEKDSFSAETLAAYFALIEAWAGEKELALQRLARPAPTPGAELRATAPSNCYPSGTRSAAIRASRKSFSRKRRNNRAKTLRTTFATHSCYGRRSQGSNRFGACFRARTSRRSGMLILWRLSSVRLSNRSDWNGSACGRHAKSSRLTKLGHDRARFLLRI